MIRASFVIAALAAVARAQQVPTTASESDLALVQQEWENSGFDVALPNSQSFGIALQPAALLSVVYGNTLVSNGQALTASQVAQFPTITVTPAANASADFAATNQFTIILADAAAAGLADPRGDYRHYLANGVTVAGANGSNSTLTPNTGNVVTQYAGPGPNAGEGPHRYAWMMFQQPANFQSTLTGNQPAGPWSVNQYVTQSNLGTLVAASFFTVQNGQATFSVVQTSAPVSTAAPSSSAPASAGASSSSRAGAATPAPSGSAAPKSGAMSLVPAAGLGAALAAFVGAIMA